MRTPTLHRLVDALIIISRARWLNPSPVVGEGGTCQVYESGVHQEKAGVAAVKAQCFCLSLFGRLDSMGTAAWRRRRALDQERSADAFAASRGFAKLDRCLV